MPTLDELQAQLDVLTQRVNEITTPPDDYYTHRFSGEEIDNAVDRVKATPGSGAITAGDVGAAPSGFGFGELRKNIGSDSKEETYEAYCAKIDAFIKNIPDNVAMLVNAYPPQIYGRVSLVNAILIKTNQLVSLECISTPDKTYGGWRIVKYLNVWQPFEWVSPPMQIGVEYRLTERYMEKPVYAKLVNFGKLPDSANASVAHNIENILHAVSGVLRDQDGTILNDYYLINSFTVARTNISIKTTGDMSATIGTVLMKYTKTTD